MTPRVARRDLKLARLKASATERLSTTRVEYQGIRDGETRSGDAEMDLRGRGLIERDVTILLRIES